ncbi:MAG: nitroreductase family protein [Candidatus Nealsonbacteria bacterium]
MNIYELIEKRRSVRSFRDDPITDETLNNILNAGRMAPSAQNAQEYKFVIVKEKGTVKTLANASNQRFIAEAPIVIAFVSLNPKVNMINDVPSYPVDLAIAIDHITLSAVEEGLGTCWITSFSQEQVKEILNIGDKYKVVALMPLGVPYDDPQVKSRKKLKDLVCEETFSE